MIPTVQTRIVRGWNRLRFRWRREQLAVELEEELAFHREQKQAENESQGVAAQPAAELSRRQMGNMTLAREECSDMWSFMKWERIAQDLRHATRMYGRTPVFTAICILSIALGIGGNTAMFSLVNALLVRPLPYQEPERIVRITGIFPRAAVPYFSERSRAMEIATVSPGAEFTLTGEGEASRFFGSSASPNFLTVLGVSVAAGRGFKPGEELPGRDRTVLIGHSLWKDRFGGNSSVIGRIIRLNGVEREIVGVMPAGFSYPSSRVQLWVPMRIDPSNFLEYWGTQFMPLIARLRPGASLVQAQGEVRTLVSTFRNTFPYPMARDFNADSTAIPLQQDIVGDVRGKLLILLCSVAAVLFIACANVAGLLLSRATTRRRELALRAALGAGRMRIIRQLLTESVGLSLTGAALGVLLGAFGLSVFKSVLPSTLPGVAQAAIDWQVLAAVIVLALFTGLAAGLAPALSASGFDIAGTIKSGGQRGTSQFWTRLRGVIIVGEVAVTLVLLVSAGLLLKSVYRLSVVNPGFNPANVLTVRISPNQSLCMQREACIAFYDRLLRQAAAVTGVSDAAVANSVPLDGRVPSIPVDVEGHPKSADNPAPLLWFEAVSPNYLGMMQIPLLAGRYLTAADGPMSEAVAVIPAATAKRYWPAESAIGKHIRGTGSKTWRTVVGVVGDVQHFSLNQALPPGVAGVIYVPYSQSERGDGQIPAAMSLLVKAGADSIRAARAIEQLAREQDPNIPVGRAQALEEDVSGSISETRATMLVFASFAGAALILAGIGIYGLMSYWVSQRLFEIGLRVAMGCTRQGILSMILAHGLKLTLCGVVAGIFGALLLTRFLATLLFGVAATDLLTFVAVTAMVIGAGVIAMAFPAWRATRVDPITTLRAE
jgi:predicted permease